MIIKKTGKYELIKDFYTRDTISCSVLLKGSVVEITQVDDFGKKIIGPQLKDWERWDMPVKVIKNKP